MTIPVVARPDGPARRGVDLIVAAVGGVLLTPVMAIVAVLVRIGLGRPVLFRQRRSGRDGHEFTIVKFRTMRPPAYARESDLTRDTPLGRGLRTLSLDE